ncbi:hypothetical protein BGX28_007120 [Mortierella sp. GBA30]|nr:hypothetical protein BGX28_007120 [Mortierella sp. GBA30]
MRVQIAALKAILAIHLPPPPPRSFLPRHQRRAEGTVMPIPFDCAPPPSRAEPAETHPVMRITRARKERVMNRAKGALTAFRTPHVVSRRFIHKLATHMQSNWNVHICRGEADIGVPTGHQNVTVATSDSDFFFHGPEFVLRQDPRNKSQFRLYDVQDVMRKLGMTSDAWTVVAVVSNNDYTHNVRGCGVSTNIDTIKVIRGVRGMKDVPNLKGYLTSGLGAFFQQCRRRLADQFQTHFLQHTAEMIFAGQGRAVLDTVNIKKGTSAVHDQLSLFFILNSRPAEAQQVFFYRFRTSPTSSFTSLSTILWTLYSKLDSTRLQVLGKNRQDTLNRISDHPGDLIFRLFVSDRVDYRNDTVLIAPDEHCDAVKDRSLMVFDHADKDEFARRCWMRVSTTKISRGNKPPSTPVPNTTKAKLMDVMDVLGSEDQIEEVLPGQTDYVIIGIDPGICETVPASVLDTRTPGVLKNVSVSQGSSKFSTKKFLSGSNHAKRKISFRVKFVGDGQAEARNIMQLESHTAPIRCIISTDVPRELAWQALSHSIKDRIVLILEVQEELRVFYTTNSTRSSPGISSGQRRRPRQVSR